MSVTINDLEAVEPAVIAADFATPNIGGGKTSNLILGSTIGELFFEMPSHEDGSASGDMIQYSKMFVRNDHPTDDYGSGTVYVANGLDDWGAGSDTITFQSTSPLDDATKKARAVGEDINGDPVCLETALGGLIEVASFDVLTWLSRVTTHDVNTNAFVTMVGDLLIRRGNGTVLGIIPANYFSATQEIDIGLAGALDDTLTTADAATAPAGITFSRARDLATAIAVANGGVLTAQTAQGVWRRWTVREGIKPNPDVQIVTRLAGVAL